jgi:hypothetical protein
MIRILLFAVLTSGCATTRVTGIWLAEGQPSMPWTVVLNANGSTVTGAVSLVDSGPIEIFDGRLDADAVTFKCKSPDGARMIEFNARVAGDHLTVTRRVDVPPGASRGGNGIFGAGGPMRFEAVRISTSPAMVPHSDATTDIDRRDRPVTQADVRILRRAAALLGRDSVWNKADDRECGDDEASGKRSLFCALQRATIEVLGSYDHRRVALQEVRFAIEDTLPGVDFEHRLMNFNNLPSTRLSDVHRVLAVAGQHVRARLDRR